MLGCTPLVPLALPRAQTFECSPYERRSARPSYVDDTAARQSCLLVDLLLRHKTDHSSIAIRCWDRPPGCVAGTRLLLAGLARVHMRYSVTALCCSPPVPLSGSSITQHCGASESTWPVQQPGLAQHAFRSCPTPTRPVNTVLFCTLKHLAVALMAPLCRMFSWFQRFLLLPRLPSLVICSLPRFSHLPCVRARRCAAAALPCCCCCCCCRLAPSLSSHAGSARMPVYTTSVRITPMYGTFSFGHVF